MSNLIMNGLPSILEASTYGCKHMQVYAGICRQMPRNARRQRHAPGQSPMSRSAMPSAILPHPEALEYLRAKGTNYDRWLGGMLKLFLKCQER